MEAINFINIYDKIAVEQKQTSAESNIIDAESKFVKRRLNHEFSWEPTDEIEKAIIQAVL